MLLGVSISTLRRWENEGRLWPSFRTCGQHRRYAVNDLHALMVTHAPEHRKVVAYALVSSHDQKEELVRQRDRRVQYCHSAGHWDVEILSDLGSVLNYQKKAFLKLLRMIARAQVSTLVLLHKERLLRFGADIILNCASCTKPRW